MVVGVAAALSAAARSSRRSSSNRSSSSMIHLASQAVLGDFGIARHRDCHTQIGTPGFVAPEVFRVALSKSVCVL